MAAFSPEWWSALAAIIVIDLVLAGDNAIVIGLAARNVPAAMQRRVVLWGTFGAIAVRVLLTGVVVWLLKIPGFLLVGGLALVWIAWRLTAPGGGGGHEVKSAATVRGAIQTIVVADAVMGVDNVLAIGGAAHGSFLLVLIGLAISVPIVVWGSTLILKWVDRFPLIILGGAAVLGWTAAKMIATEPLVRDQLALHGLVPVLYAGIVGIVLAPAIWRGLKPDEREHVVGLGVVVAWLGAFSALERWLGRIAPPVADWSWWYDLIDIAMWTGWIPVVAALLALRRRRQASPIAVAARQR